MSLPCPAWPHVPRAFLTSASPVPAVADPAALWPCQGRVPAASTALGSLRSARLCGPVWGLHRHASLLSSTMNGFWHILDFLGLFYGLEAGQ